jgi:hypothetical protein
LWRWREPGGVSCATKLRALSAPPAEIIGRILRSLGIQTAGMWLPATYVVS